MSQADAPVLLDNLRLHAFREQRLGLSAGAEVTPEMVGLWEACE